jgi:8-oxo-dGTP pyrophosphatase MutT (NUDIX family)
MTELYESNESAWTLLSRGKVRDVYEYAPNEMLIVTSDRLSAFDVILPTPIPDKGVVLTQIANFWFDKTNAIIPNHIVDPEPFSTDPERKHLAGRSIVVHRAEALPVEAIVRGYLTGSGRKDYEKTGKVCGIELPAGLVEKDERTPEGLRRCAARELHEEVGLEVAADRMIPLGPSTFPAPGMVGERHFFFQVEVDPARRTTPPEDGSPLEMHAVIASIPLTEALARYRSVVLGHRGAYRALGALQRALPRMPEASLLALARMLADGPLSGRAQSAYWSLASPALLNPTAALQPV